MYALVIPQIKSNQNWVLSKEGPIPSIGIGIGPDTAILEYRYRSKIDRYCADTSIGLFLEFQLLCIGKQTLKLNVVKHSTS